MGDGVRWSLRDPQRWGRGGRSRLQAGECSTTRTVPVSFTQDESEGGAKVLRSVASIPQECEAAGSLYHFSTHN